jgi:replicative DNA helicase
MDALRAPPHSIEAEQAVLGGLMLDPRALPRIVDVLTPDSFFVGNHRTVFKAITELAAKGTPHDAVTLAEWFAGQGGDVPKASFVMDIASNTPGASNIAAYADIVAEKWRLRLAIDVGTKAASDAYRPGADSAVIIAEAAQALGSVAQSRIRGGLAPVRAAMGNLYVDLTLRHENQPKMLGLETPWLKLNQVTKGLRKGVLYVVGARPSMGKSIFGLQCAGFAALRGHRAAVFSVEMTREECLSRAMACHGEIPFEWVEQPYGDEHWSKLMEVNSLIANSALLLDDTPQLTIDQLVARARRAHINAPLELVVIDHLHDMKIDPRAESRFEFGRITQGAKTIAKELDCPVVLLAQLGRSVETRTDKRPVLADLRESGEIEQKADVVLFMYREDYYNAETHLKGVVELIPAKGRNIRVGQPIHLRNRFDQMRLEDWLGDLPKPKTEERPITTAKKRGFRKDIDDRDDEPVFDRGQKVA